MPAPPRVVITATTEIIRDALRVRVNVSYVRAVEQAGGVPLVLPPLGASSGVEHLLDVADALILSGGEDVDPSLYGAERHPRLGRVNAARDATEIALVQAARERRIPTLAICRGIQVLNVALGGTLVQDLPSERPSDITHDHDLGCTVRVHDVEVDAASRLAQLVGATRLRVNSSHHQAVDAVAPGLCVSARAPDGVVEAVDWEDDDWWALGVQWHPEEMVATSESWDRALFAGLLERVAHRSRRASRPVSSAVL